MDCRHIICLLFFFLPHLQAFFSYSYRVDHSPRSWSWVQFNPTGGESWAQPAPPPPPPRRRQATIEPNCENSPNGYYVGKLYARSSTKCYNLCREAGMARRYYCCHRGYSMDIEQRLCIARGDGDGYAHRPQRPMSMPTTLVGQYDTERGQAPKLSTIPSRPTSLASLYEQQQQQRTQQSIKVNNNIIERAPAGSGCRLGLLRGHPGDDHLYYLCSPDRNFYELRRCPAGTRWSAPFKMCYDSALYDQHLNPVGGHPTKMEMDKKKEKKMGATSKLTGGRKTWPWMSPSHRSRCFQRWQQQTSPFTRRQFNPANCRDKEGKLRRLEGLKKKKKSKTSLRPESSLEDDRSSEDDGQNRDVQIGEKGAKTSMSDGKINIKKKHKFWEIRRKITTTTSRPTYDEEEVVALTTTTTTTTLAPTILPEVPAKKLPSFDETTTTTTTMLTTTSTTEAPRKTTTTSTTEAPREITTTTTSTTTEPSRETTPQYEVTYLPTTTTTKEYEPTTTTTKEYEPTTTTTKEYEPTTTTKEYEPPTTTTSSPPETSIDIIDTPQPIVDTTTTQLVNVTTLVTTTTTTTTTTTPPPPLILNEGNNCYEPGARYSDGEDCQCFYRCELDRRLSRQCCPDGQYFNQLDTRPGEGTITAEESSEDEDINSYCEPADRVQCKNIIQ